MPVLLALSPALEHHPDGLPEGYRLKRINDQCVAIAAAPDYITQALCFLYHTTASYCATHRGGVVDFNKLFYVRVDGKVYFTDSVPRLLNFATGDIA